MDLGALPDEDAERRQQRDAVEARAESGSRDEERREARVDVPSAAHAKQAPAAREFTELSLGDAARAKRVGAEEGGRKDERGVLTHLQARGRHADQYNPLAVGAERGRSHRWRDLVIQRLGRGRCS